MKNNETELIINNITIPLEVFTKKFAPCDLAACGHACCQYGCIMGEIRITKINKLLPKLYPLMRPEAVNVAKKSGIHTNAVFSRSDMDQTHKHYSVRTVNKRCIFLNYNQDGGCVLQKYCEQENIKHSLKPEGCWGFPIDLVGNRLTVYNWRGLDCLNLPQNSNAPFIYKSCKSELSGFLGEKGYKELIRKAKSFKQLTDN